MTTSEPEKIVVTGGTGYVGRALVRRLSAAGKAVTVLSRSAVLPRDLSALAGVRGAVWQPGSAGEWAAELEGASVLVHLAGRQAVGQRYTKRVKDDIYASRVQSTESLVTALARVKHKPSVFVCASGVGYYGGFAGDHAPLDESKPPGDDFLSHVVVEWEARARAAEALGLRVVSARLSPVLGRGGGALGVMALPFKLMVGGPLGSGKQVFPWVHLEDALDALELCMRDARLSGPVNVVAPNAVTNREASRLLGRALHRPSWLAAPAFALRLLFGEGAVPILTGQRAYPGKLEAAGFSFRYPTLAEALAQACA
jgi:uncharacterized protein (TIGR01777 family)